MRRITIEYARRKCPGCIQSERMHLARAILILLFALSVAPVLFAIDLPTVRQVDLNRYMGKWYEIARFPNRFQRDCASDTSAEYKVRGDGKVEVINSCREKNGRVKSVSGTAKVVDSTTNAKLKVTFFWPFYGDYWIIALGENYEYAVVGEPSRKYLWILSRTPTLDDATYRRVLERVKAVGYDTAKLQKTSHGQR